jgi:hypothetical protein
MDLFKESSFCRNEVCFVATEESASAKAAVAENIRAVAKMSVVFLLFIIFHPSH